MIQSGKSSIVSGVVAILMCGLQFLIGAPVFAQDAKAPVMAPLNPDFINYMNTIRLLGVENVTPNGYGLGHIPSPIDRSYLTGQSVFPIPLLGTFPSTYDLRTLGKVTPVKNQGSCGDCWAFGAMGSLESNLLTAETWDFSENNLKNTSGFDYGPCDGGNEEMATAYFARWGDPVYTSGPVLESVDPYNPSSGVSPSGLTVQKHVQEVLIIPPRGSSTDNDNIKQAVMTYGAVATVMYWDGPGGGGPSYNTTNMAYYYNSTAPSNHSVDIVGWDDNYSASNFNVPPPGNGAFLIRNSWGTSFGISGYFYISYYDSVVGGNNYVFNGAQPTTNYIRAYQYDPLGMTTSFWFGGGPTTTDWFANVFTATATESLVAVSFYTDDVSVSYTITIYTNSTSGPTSGTLAGTTTGSITTPGYHTVTLSSPVSITSGQNFSVVVKLMNSSYTYPIPIEYPFNGYSSAATASAGQSYVSSDGTTWYDLTSYYPNTNVCVKAFTATVDTLPPGLPTSLSATPAIWTNTNSFSINWTNPSDPSGIVGAYYKVGSSPNFDTDGTYTTSKPFIASATAQGGQSIYIWLRDGSGNTSYSNNASTTLFYDGTAPSDGTLSVTPAPTQVLLSWSGFSDSGGSGLNSTNTYKVTRNTGAYPSNQCTDGTQVYIGTGTSETDTGLSAGTTYYYRVCAYDNAGNVSTGATATATTPVQITIATSPSGLQFTLDSLTYIAPQTFTLAVGSSHTFTTTSPQSGGAGTQYVFSSWSDGGGQTHTSTTSASVTTYTATFATQYQLTTTVNPSGSGSVNPDCSGGCWFNSGTAMSLAPMPTGSDTFSSWAGDISSLNAPLLFTLNGANNITANFNSVLVTGTVRVARMTPIYYDSIQSAYASAINNDVIQTQAISYGGALNFNRSDILGLSVTLEGGYNATYSDNTGKSILGSPLTIGSGTITLDNIVIQ
jgi:C1A family cysteine protease